MKPKRRRRNSPDKECWNKRTEVLDDFFTPPDHVLSQQNIEWSSSDEEDLFNESRASTSTVKRLTPVKEKILDAFPSVSTIINSKLNFIKPSSSEPNFLANNQASVHERNLNLIPRELSTPVSFKNKSSCVVKVCKEVNSGSKFKTFVEPAKTPTKSVCQKDSKKGLDASPVIGLNHTQCAPNKVRSQNTDISGSVESSSHSKKVLSKNFIKRHLSSVQGLSGENSVTKNTSFTNEPVNNDNDYQPPVSPLIGSSQVHNKFRHQNKRSFENYLGDKSPILGSSRNTIQCAEVIEDRKKTLDEKDDEYMRVRLKGRNLYTKLNQKGPNKPARNCTKEHMKNAASYHHSDAKKGEKDIYDYAFGNVFQDEVEEVISQPHTFGEDNQLGTNGKEDEINDFGYNILSQSDSECQEVISQPNTSDGEKLFDIDVCESPMKNSQASSPVLLKGSIDPTISSESTLSPKEGAAVTNEISKNVGFHWIRTLQQHTPEKQACEPAEFVDSTKKRERKDGEAARLRRFINSWQSDIQVWLHETSVKNLKTRPPKIGETTAKIFSPGSATSHIKRELYYEKPSKPLLQGIKSDKIDIDSSQSSSSFEPMAKSKTEEKKFVTLKVLKIGDGLQGNAALCEDYGECSRNFLEDNKEDSSGSLKMLREAEPLKYYVYFSHGDNKPPNLHVGDKIAIYAPWHYLEISAQKIPVLFASFFKAIKDDITSDMSDFKGFSRKNEKIMKRSISSLPVKKTCLVKWSCNCVMDPSILPSMCDSRKPKVASNHEFQEFIEYKDGTPTLRSVKNASQEIHQNDPLRAGTVSEAVEKCGGPSVKQCSIVVRVHRVISHRKQTQNIDKWEVIAQDANGIFCTVDIPNRPLVREITQLIEEGEGQTWHFTHVDIVERLTDSQNPGLFSLISSLHHSYQKALQNNPLLCPLLVDHVTSSSQTFCYVFNVNLGVTKVFNNDEEVVIPLSLPIYSLGDIFQITAESQRGSVSFLILYKRGDLLYVMSEEKEPSDDEPFKDSLHKTESKEGNSNMKKFSKDDAKNIIVKVEVRSKTILPRWIPPDGTIMMYVSVRDAAIWHGNLIIDNYTVMQPVDKKSDITLSTLVTILKPLSSRSNFQDLTVVSGTIQKVDEENAATWTTCSKCSSAEVQETLNGARCSSCDLNNVALNTQYYMEIWLSCGTDLKHAEIKVKLYQTTIQKLLKSCEEKELEVCIFSQFHQSI
ncbi:uncharacterized protein [Palaemon carinicauda]|uniref:uncharacterized protein isoform X2 n=1 Tax=Palaemon carinicauda TaxID=392227 RepID=UPI0035B597D8